MGLAQYVNGRKAPPFVGYSVSVDRDGKSYRGGQCRAVVGNSVDIRLHLEANVVGDRTTTRSTFVGHDAAVGCPCVCEVDPSNNHAIVAVYPAPPADHSLERAWEQDGQTFSPGRVTAEYGGRA